MTVTKTTRLYTKPSAWQLLLELAQSGDFVQLARFLDCITISDDVVRKLIDIFASDEITVCSNEFRQVCNRRL
jgi:hypothetical protein